MLVLGAFSVHGSPTLQIQTHSTLDRISVGAFCSLCFYLGCLTLSHHLHNPSASV